MNAILMILVLVSGDLKAQYANPESAVRLGDSVFVATQAPTTGWHAVLIPHDEELGLRDTESFDVVVIRRQGGLYGQVIQMLEAKIVVAPGTKTVRIYGSDGNFIEAEPPKVKSAKKPIQGNNEP